MKITLKVNGFTFVSAPIEDLSAEDMKDILYKDFSEMDKLEMECNDGSFIIIGKEALQNAILICSE